jgi:hypothetical protein
MASAASRPVAAVDELLAFESRVAGLFADGRLTAVCQYDRQSFDQVTLAFAAKAHPRAVAAAVYYEDPLLRKVLDLVGVTDQPGVRVRQVNGRP